MIDWNDNAKAAVKAYDDWAGNESSMYVSYMDEFMQGIKQTKTVADAVEWAKGVWPNSFSKKACAIGINLETGNFVVWDKNSFNKSSSYIVCDYKQFEGYVKEQESEKWTHIDGDGDKCKVLHTHNEIAWVTYYGEYEDNIVPIEELKPIKPTISAKEAIDMMSKSAFVNWTVSEFMQHLRDDFELEG